MHATASTLCSRLLFVRHFEYASCINIVRCSIRGNTRTKTVHMGLVVQEQAATDNRAQFFKASLA